MNARGLAGLLADVLNAQIDDAPADGAAPEIWSQAILGQRRLTPQEEKLLWTSPQARSQFLRLRREILQPARNGWRSADRERSCT